MRLQFGIKFLLLLIVIAAFASFVVVNRIRFKERWSEVRLKLEAWEARHGSYPQSSYAFDVEDRNGEQVFVAIGTCFFIQKGNNITVGKKDPQGRAAKTYYVTPPGKWVSDLDEAIRLWDQL